MLPVYISKSLLIILLCIAFTSNGQERLIKGQVTDSLSAPLVYANIMAEALQHKQAPVFTMTDEKGHYKLHLLNKFSYKVSVLYMGYQPAVFVVDSLSGDLVKNVILKPKKNQLDEVVVVADLPVKVKEDTITYKPEKFLTGEERKLKDVLKKLPGVEVDKNGAVSVMGKKVSQILVEDKAFFGGGTKLAVDNIPADAVDKIVAVDDYNSIGFMKGLTDEQKMIINIKLKEGKKHFVFGDISAGGNTKQNYFGKANLFYYSPKTNLNYIGNLNDIGEAPLNMNDFMRFEGGMSDLGKLKSNFQNFNQISNLFFTDYFVKKKTQFSALQWQQDFSPKLNFNTYVILSKDHIETHQTGYNQYLSSVPLTEEKDTRQNQTNFNGFGKMSLRYKTAVFNYLDVVFIGKTTDNRVNKNIQSVLNQSGNFICQTQNNQAQQWSNNLAWHRKFNRKNTLRFLSHFKYTNAKPSAFWQTDQAVLNQILPLQTSSVYNIQQNLWLQNKLWDVELKHYWLINGNHHIYSSIGNHWADKNFYSYAYQKLSDGSTNDFTATGFNNDLQMRLNDVFAGLQYKFMFKKWVMKAGIFAHYYTWHFVKDYNKNRSAYNLLPEISFQKKMHFSQKFEFQYRLKSVIPDISKYLKYYYLTGYNHIQKGNIDIENELIHTFRLHYGSFSLSDQYQYYVRMSYQYKPASIQNKIFYVGIDTYQSPVLVSLPNQSLQATLFFKRDFKKFYISVKPALQANKYVQNIQNTWHHIQTLWQSYELKTGTYFKDYPNIDLGVQYSVNRYQSDVTQNDYTQISPFLTLQYDFAKAFNFKAHYKYVTTNSLLKNSDPYHNADISLLYQTDKSPWGLELQISNLFNHSVINNYNQSEIMISNNSVFIQPRLWLLKLYYKL
ncbi:MAG TPA: carboxypeptidase-like regulatory domain-containing protein [Flavobacteriales bacterium]|nr:carboxypeptidase-like regulatory domain-containing protein [Flavobacteriales bacterium]